MIERSIQELVDEEVSTFSFAHEIDVECFLSHRIFPKPISLCMDFERKEWRECYLVTDHNGLDDSPYRMAFDPECGQFVREITLEDGTPHYLVRGKCLEDLVDLFA
jgi:hypothetical protein